MLTGMLLAVLVSAPFNYYPLDLKQYSQYPIPTTTDSQLNSILKSKNTVFYKLHPAYQQYVPQHNVYNVYYQEVLEDYNSNLDFPWETTFGLNHAKKEKLNNYFAINFIFTKKPIIFVRGKPSGWVFPKNNIVVGEILYLKDGEKWLPFEIRCRVKRNEDWQVLRFAPIKNRQHLIQFIGDYKPSKKYLFLRNNVESEVFKIEGMIERVPPIDKETVRKLLDRPFSNVTEEPWSDYSYVPTADDTFNIYPRNYSLGLLHSVDRVSCAHCHRQTGISVNNLVPEEPIIRDNQPKVGNIRGSDGIFTWHPFDESCIQNKTGETQPDIVLRKYDLDHHIVEEYQPGKQYEDDYKLTGYVDGSLKVYEKINIDRFLNEEEKTY